MLLLACLGSLAAANAGRSDEDGTGAVWVAPELLSSLDSTQLHGCMHDVVIEPVRMQADGRVDFEWHPETGELSFAAETAHAITRPGASSEGTMALAMQSCGSR